MKTRFFKRSGIILAIALLLTGFGLHQIHAQQDIQTMKAFIKSIYVGEPVYYENLTILPVYTRRIIDYTRYVTLDEALEKGWLTIKEKDGGDVPFVLISNNTSKIIYIMGGEILSGCKQDRIVSGDVLIGPKKKRVKVPVYCVEAGRWSYNSKEFSSEKNLGTYKIRAKAQTKKAEAQDEIWNEVAESNRKLGVQSGTSAFQDAYRDRKLSALINEAESKMHDILKINPDTVGVVIGLNGRIISVDIFANPYMFDQFWPKILKSTVLSMSGRKIKTTVSQADAASYLQMIYNSKMREQQAVDLGTEIASIDSDPNICALTLRKAVIHLAAFSD